MWKNKRIIQQTTIFIILILYANISFAQESVIIKKGQNLTTLADKMYMLVDSTRKITIKDILKAENQKKFFPNFAGHILLPVAPYNTWFKFTVENQAEEDVWIDLMNTFVWEFDVYVLDSAGKYTQIVKSGLSRPQKDKPRNSSHYVIPILEHDQTKAQTFYVKIYAKLGMAYIPKIGVGEKVIYSVRLYDYRMNIYLGLMLVMILYNAFIGYITKERVYFYYVVYLLYVALVIPISVGDSFIHSEGLLDYLPVWGALGYVVPALFAFRYLNIQKNAKFFYKAIIIITTILVLLSFLFLLGFLSHTSYYTSAFLLGLIYNPLLWSVGVYLWIKGYKNARFYTIAWTSVLGASILNFLIVLGFVLFEDYLSNVMYIAFGLETVLFSIALGDRMNALQREKEEAQQENLRLIEEQKDVLETKVKERTLELQEANEELQVMNEEMHQSQEEMATQRDFLDQQNTKLNSQQKQIHSSIKSAQSIQQAILPYQEKLDSLLKEHFVINRPKDVVSGDFYWINKIDNKIILIVGDCTGHGVPGAFMTLIANNLLDKIVRLRKITNPAEILNNLHQEIQIVLRQKKTDNNNGMDAVIISMEENGIDYKINFAGAKNDLWYFKPDVEEIQILKGTRKSIGGVQNESIQFENQTILLSSESSIYLGSDGFEDQNNAKRKKFGREKLKGIMTENRYLEMNIQKENLNQILQEYMENTDQRDDILWMGIKL